MEGRAAGEAHAEAMDYLVALTKFGMNLGLDRIRALMARLGNPEKHLQVVHVGGTNGKGSTTVMVAEILREAGYKTGVFTSPHLYDYRERIAIDGHMIDREKVVDILSRFRPILEELVATGMEHPTEFEVSTAMALVYFAEAKVDFALIEVGLGGEIDSTNVVSPLVAVVTNVGMDHMEYLGDRIEDIARVKAGILKKGSVAVTAADRSEVLDVLRRKAAEVDAKLWEVGRDVQWEKVWSGEWGQEFNLSGIHGYYPGIRVSLAGDHQIKNAATALAVCEVLAADYGVFIPREAIYSGFKKVQWPGRLELLSSDPKVLLDGAHNLDGAEALANALGHYERKSLVLCLGMLADKEREKVVNLLLPLADEVVITKPNSPRAGDWEKLAELARNYTSRVAVIADPGEAALYGLGVLKPGDMLCVTGSLYMIPEARRALLKALNEHNRVK